jgi:predicted metal-dependent hydrolase
MCPIKGRSLSSKAAGELSYRLVRSKKRKKTLALQIKRDGTIMMLVPHRTSEEEAERFFRQKEAWVRKKLEERTRFGEPAGPGKTFSPGDVFPYLGEQYPLDIASSTGSGEELVLSYGTFLLRQDKLVGARDVFVGWYKRRAREELVKRVVHYSRRFDLPVTGVTITSARSRLGSCSARNKISLTWRLIMAPYPVIDYVVLHELAHVKEKNHSKQFWDFLETMLPDYRQHRLWLKRNGHLLAI